MIPRKEDADKCAGAYCVSFFCGLKKAKESNALHGRQRRASAVFFPSRQRRRQSLWPEDKVRVLSTRALNHPLLFFSLQTLKVKFFWQNTLERDISFDQDIGGGGGRGVGSKAPARASSDRLPSTFGPSIQRNSNILLLRGTRQPIFSECASRAQTNTLLVYYARADCSACQAHSFAPALVRLTRR